MELQFGEALEAPALPILRAVLLEGGMLPWGAVQDQARPPALPLPLRGDVGGGGSVNFSLDNGAPIANNGNNVNNGSKHQIMEFQKDEGDPALSVTISMPYSLKRKLEELADQRTYGNLSAVVKQLVLHALEAERSMPPEHGR